MKQLVADPRHAFAGQGQMTPEQLEIAQIEREVARLKAERDILKKRPTSRIDMKFAFIRPAEWLCGALGVSPSFLASK